MSHRVNKQFVDAINVIFSRYDSLISRQNKAPVVKSLTIQYTVKDG